MIVCPHREAVHEQRPDLANQARMQQQMYTYGHIERTLPMLPLLPLQSTACQLRDTTHAWPRVIVHLV